MCLVDCFFVVTVFYYNKRLKLESQLLPLSNGAALVKNPHLEGEQQYLGCAHEKTASLLLSSMFLSSVAAFKRGEQIGFLEIEDLFPSSVVRNNLPNSNFPTFCVVFTLALPINPDPEQSPIAPICFHACQLQ